jgi:hypothetical protein
VVTQAVFKKDRGFFGPRRMRGGDWDRLSVARDLRGEVFG